VLAQQPGGKGHNVTALVLPDGRYAVVISETRPGRSLFPNRWKAMGGVGDDPGRQPACLQHQHHGAPGWRLHDCTALGACLHQQSGRRHSRAVSGLGRLSPRASRISKTLCLVFGGLYHIVVNSWSTRKTYHLNLERRQKQLAQPRPGYDPTRDFIATPTARSTIGTSWSGPACSWKTAT